MKYINYIIVILFTFFMFNIDCFASTKTYERNDKDYRVPKNVIVNESNVNDILNTYSIDASEKIYDFADLLSVDEEKKLYKMAKSFTDNTGIDSIIVTTNSLNGYQISNFTYNFYDYNDFKNDGIILTIYVDSETNKSSIYMGNNGGTGSKVFKVYDDTNINNTLKYVYENHIRKGDYFSACSDYFIITDGLYVKAYGGRSINDKSKLFDIPWFYILITSFCLSFITVVVVYTKSNVKVRRFDNSIKRSANLNTMIVKKEYDKAVNGCKVKV